MQLNPQHAAVREKRTIHVKSKRKPRDGQLLKPVTANGKLGKGRRFIIRGQWRGMPMFSLTLEERKTCPASCAQWRNCFGNNMPFAHRFEHGPELTAKLRRELAVLSIKYPQGFVVRLHVLGDFYSATYARFWLDSLAAFPQLHLFGYTHRRPDDSIGSVIVELNRSARCWLRFSDFADADSVNGMTANVNGAGLQCPEQTGKTESCLTCGLCWAVRTPIKFLEH